MSFWTRLGVLFYTVTILFIACTMLLFVMKAIPLKNVIAYLYLIYYDRQMLLVVGLVSIGLILTNFMFARIITGEQVKGKTIAFDNPSGRVTISLSAMDDMIRRIIARSPEIREAKPSIVANRKGLDINIKLTLKADVNIPEMTSRLQELVKKKVHDIIGIEEPVVVKIHVVKFVSADYKSKNDSDPSIEPSIPFQGYRA